MDATQPPMTTTTTTERVLRAGWVCLASQPRPGGRGRCAAAAATDAAATPRPPSSSSSGGSGGGGPTQWRRKWAYLLPDRLCFAPAPPDADQHHRPQAPGPRVRYLPLDRLAARPHGARGGGPGLGLARLRRGLVAPPPGCPAVLALSAGGRTHYLACESTALADAWVDTIGSAWEACILDGGPRSACATAAATTATTATTAATAAMNDLPPPSAWAADPPPAPAATPRGHDDGFTTPVRAWSAGSRAAADAAPPPATSPPPSDPVARYTVTLFTATTPSDAGAPPGTDVHVELLGGRRSGPRVHLPAVPGDFARGRAATFGMELPWAGPLGGVTVRLGGPPGSGAWRLDRVDVEDERAGEAYSFPCGRWVSAGGGGVTLSPAAPRGSAALPPPPLAPPPSAHATPAPPSSSPAGIPPVGAAAPPPSYEVPLYRSGSLSRPAAGSGHLPPVSPPPTLPPLRTRSSFAVPPPSGSNASSYTMGSTPVSRGGGGGGGGSFSMPPPPPPPGPPARWPTLAVPASPSSFSTTAHLPPPSTPLARAATVAAEAKLDESERALARLADERAAAAEGDAARERAALAGVFGGLRGDVARATSQLADAEAALAASAEERARLEAALADATARASEAARAAASREAALWAEGRAATEEAAATAAAARAAADEASARAGAAESARAALEAALRAARGDAATAEADLAATRTRAEDALRRASEAAARADAAAADAADARERAAGADGAVGAARADAARARGDADAARAAAAAAVADAAAARDRAAASDADAADARAAAVDAARALAAVGDERARLAAVLDGLRAGLAAAAARVAAFQADLDGAPPPAPPGTAHRVITREECVPPRPRHRLRVEVATDGVAGAVGDVLVTLWGGGGGCDAPPPATPAAGPFRLLTEGGARLASGGTATFILEDVPDLAGWGGGGCGAAPGPPAGAAALEVAAAACPAADAPAAAAAAAHHPPGTWRLAWVRVTDLDSGESALYKGGNGGPAVLLRPGGPAALLRPAAPGSAAPAPVPTAPAPAPPPPPQPAASSAAPGYRIAFYTSAACLAGTRAQVRFELVGDDGRSGDVLLPQSARSGHFRPGAADVFTYPLLPSVGRLRALRVGTDGSGLFPAWHLAAVEVVHLPTGAVTRFACHAFVDRRCGWVRTLHGEALAGPPLRATAGALAGVASLPAPALFAPPPAYGAAAGAGPAAAAAPSWGAPAALATATGASGLVPASPSAAAWEAAVAAATAAAGRVPGPLAVGAGAN